MVLAAVCAVQQFCTMVTILAKIISICVIKMARVDYKKNWFKLVKEHSWPGDYIFFDTHGGYKQI